MSRITHTFGPSISPRCRVLILGTMPGMASLAAGAYYAHPRNVFWDIMGRLVGAGRDLPYARRLARLRAHGLALWDVVAECDRAGSLDSAIRAERANDLVGLLLRYPRLHTIVFNGQPAARLFQRHVAVCPRAVRRLILPSTSPAHAALDVEAKVKAWSRLLSFL